MTTVLITGGAGFIGQHTARMFVEAGWTAVALDTLNPKVHLDAEASQKRFPGRVVVGDVLDPSAWASIGPVDLVVHLAAETGVGQSMYEVDLYRRVNEDGTRLATEFAVNQGAPLIFFSSRAVYGQGRTECATHGTSFTGLCCEQAVPVDSIETDEFAPVSVYGETKVAGERIVSAAPVPVAIVRPQNVIGQGQALHNPYTGVLAAFLARLREGKPLQVYGDGTQTRDFIHVSDLARLVLWIAERQGGGEQPLVLNSGSGVRTTLTQLAEHAVAAAPESHRSEIEYVDVHRSGDIEHACADLSRSRNLGAPQPQIDAAAAVADFIQAGWEAPGAPASAWDEALGALDERGLIS